MTAKLMILLNYRVSEILEKGEYLAGYYNPGDLFDEVHILMTVNDSVKSEDMQFTVGRARIFIYSVPAPGFKKSLGWQYFLLQQWIRICIELVREINPNIIRVHNCFIQGYLASEIKKQLGIPYIISLHGVFDRDDLDTFTLRFMRWFRIKLEKISLRNSDAVIVVYKPIIRYAKKYGAKNIHLVYNAVAERNIKQKQDYILSNPRRLVTINRQMFYKNPENIIRAIKDIDCIYEIIGDGQYHDHLKKVAEAVGCVEKVKFIKHISNELLTASLKDYDILVAHCDYWGISKSTIEGALAGLPIIINHHQTEPLPDFEGGWVHLCDNSPEGYKKAILAFLEDQTKRQSLGETAYHHAMENFYPPEMKRKVVELYKSFMLT